MSGISDPFVRSPLFLKLSLFQFFIALRTEKLQCFSLNARAV